VLQSFTASNGIPVPFAQQGGSCAPAAARIEPRGWVPVRSSGVVADERVRGFPSGAQLGLAARRELTCRRCLCSACTDRGR
jgi:hypothetical protein